MGEFKTTTIRNTTVFPYICDQVNLDPDLTLHFYGNIGQGSRLESETSQFKRLKCIKFCDLFFNRPIISRGFHVSSLECPEMKCKGHTARTTVSRTVRMNTGRVVSHSRQYNQE